jgi:hypothetical protein
VVVACLGSRALRRTREKVDLPLFLGPHTTTTGGVGWEETVDTAEAQSGGTTASVRGAGEDDRGGVRVGVARAPAMSLPMPSPWFAEGSRAQSGARPSYSCFLRQESGPFSSGSDGEHVRPSNTLSMYGPVTWLLKKKI